MWRENERLQDMLPQQVGAVAWYLQMPGLVSKVKAAGCKLEPEVVSVH